MPVKYDGSLERLIVVHGITSDALLMAGGVENGNGSCHGNGLCQYSVAKSASYVQAPSSPMVPSACNSDVQSETQSADCSSTNSTYRSDSAGANLSISVINAPATFAAASTTSYATPPAAAASAACYGPDTPSSSDRSFNKVIHPLAIRKASFSSLNVRAFDHSLSILTTTSLTDGKWEDMSQFGTTHVPALRGVESTFSGSSGSLSSVRVRKPSRRKFSAYPRFPSPGGQLRPQRLEEQKQAGLCDLDVEREWAHEQQRRTRLRIVRIYPRGLRTKSDNYDPLPCWASGAQLCALNLQTNDLPTQLHYALFELNGGSGYVEKPKEMLLSTPCWPQPQLLLKVVTVKPITLSHLPERGEHRPHLTSARSCLHQYVSELSFSSKKRTSLRKQAGVGAVLLPSVSVELHAIGGFHCVSTVLPPMSGATRHLVHTLEGSSNGGDGNTFHYGQKVHCVAAEPMACVLRVAVVDEELGQEVAYDTVMLGAVREGYRVIHLRSMLGTRIDSCYLLVHISFSTQINAWVGEQELVQELYEQRSTIDEQRGTIDEQREAITKLEETLDGCLAENGTLKEQLASSKGNEVAEL